MTYSALKRKLRSVGDNESGLAMVELAVSLPFFLGLGIGGLELANYTSVVMQLNKITIHTADNAARIGTSTPDGVRTISEAQIKDVFAGAMRAGRSIGLEGQHSYANPSTGNATNRGNTRIILSSVEQVNPADPSDRQYRIRWQRCAGSADFYRSNYGTTTSPPSPSGIGPTGRQVLPPAGGAIMFVETHYYYKPMIVNGFSSLTDQTISQVASMVVRETRDLVGPSGGEGIYNLEKVTPSICSQS